MTRSRRLFKKVAIGVVIAFGIYLSLCIFGAIIAMQLPRLPVDTSPASVSLSYEDVSFTSRVDNVRLKGWYIPGGENLTIIVVHGGFQNRVDKTVNTLNLARDMAGAGYNLLLFDLRGRGESSGRGLSLMNIDSDIGGAVEYLKSRGCAASEIAILGFCSGAASACIFASQEHIGALVLDGCFADVRGMVTRQAAQRKIPRFLGLLL